MADKTVSDPVSCCYCHYSSYPPNTLFGLVLPYVSCLVLGYGDLIPSFSFLPHGGLLLYCSGFWDYILLI